MLYPHEINIARMLDQCLIRLERVGDLKKIYIYYSSKHKICVFVRNMLSNKIILIIITDWSFKPLKGKGISETINRISAKQRAGGCVFISRI